MQANIIALFYILIGFALSSSAWANKADSSYIWSQDPRFQLYKQGQDYRFEPKKDLDKSLYYHLKAAKADYAASQYAVGYILGFDKDRDPDFAQSLFWMMKVIEPHQTPQIPQYETLTIEANKALRTMCKKGVVDFPDNHPFSKDPYCWRKRGDKLFNGRDKLGELLGRENHGVEQNFVKSRYYLEKAYEAGEKSTSINLAKIYKDGLGIDSNIKKYHKYQKAAAELGDSGTHLTLAKKAKTEGRTAEYIEHLEIASKSNGTNGRSASRTLGRVYFQGELVPRDPRKAFMHFFLSGRDNYARGDKATLPWANTDMIIFLRDELALNYITNAKADAEAFSKKHKFKSLREQDIKVSYNQAMRDLDHVQRTGGHWYKDRRSWSLLTLLLFIIVMEGFNSSRAKH